MEDPIELHDDEYEAWMANEQRQSVQDGGMISDFWQAELKYLQSTLSIEDIEAKLRALDRLDQYLADDEEA